MRRIVFAVLPLLLVGGCREADQPAAPVPSAGLVVESDPSGGRIHLNNRATGTVTPDTVLGLSVGQQQLLVTLDSGGFTYRAEGRVPTVADELRRVLVPLLLSCSSTPCFTDFHRGGSVRFAVSATGPLMFLEGQGSGVFWPAESGNSYASTAMPVLAGIAVASGDTLSLGPYDVPYMTGRPAPDVEEAPFRLRQTAWILPPPQVLQFRTIRGIEVEEEVVAGPPADNSVIVRLTFRNITDRHSYVTLDPFSAGGVTYQEVWLGLALDGDVGRSEDDLISYFPELDMAVLYDSDFRETDFTADWRERPGLVGLRMLSAPPGTAIRLNGWPRGMDWQADGLRALAPGAAPQPERRGWGWLSARQTVLPSHEDPRLGHAPTAPNDYRISVAAGPVHLAPGDSATVTLAVVFADPEPGTFTSGTVVPSGDPLDTQRQLYAVGARLREQALLAEALAAERF